MAPTTALRLPAAVQPHLGQHGQHVPHRDAAIRRAGVPGRVRRGAGGAVVAEPLLVGGGVDRHENIGEGLIGREGFKVILGHPALREIPFLLEVPGFDKKGPDKENLDILRQIREEVGLPPKADPPPAEG